MPYTLLLSSTLLLLCLSRTVYILLRNIINARAIGVPMLLVPIDQTSLLWLILSTSNRHRLQRLLPRWLWKRVSLTILGWEFHEQLRPFKELTVHHGDELCKSFLLVGFGGLDFWTADPKAAQEICLRVHDFEVPRAMEAALGQYGPNVMTTNGDIWARHRRIVTSVIDDRILKAVFDESIRQTSSLLGQTFSSHTSHTDLADTRLIFDMVKKITIHVLFHASMGTKAEWSDESGEPEPGYRMTQIESLTAVVSNLAGAAIIPTRILTGWPSWLPGHSKMEALGRAKVEVHKRTKSKLERERSYISASERRASKTNNIMHKLLQESEGHHPRYKSLSEDEMVSTLFVLTAAGFETTATTLAYAIVLLARHAQWQDWLLEEVDALTPTDNNTQSIDYVTMFPRASRIMAFMLETVRLYSPAPHVHREVKSQQTLHTSTGTVRLPPGTRVYVNSMALHLLPSWRDINRQSDPDFAKPDPDVLDEYTFRPSRWINPPGSPHVIYRPPKGTFLPWAMGPRVCPGQKMAQVEFTAVLLAMMQRHRISATPLEGEGQVQMQRRLDARLRDSRWVTVLQMNGVFDVKETGGEGLSIRVSKRK
ncbi:cytochrome P450 [Nemania sp. NC0429]|nr:cytochrome P450 [Nemania sp. NC0429]